MKSKKLAEFQREPEKIASGWVQTAILKSGASIPRIATLVNRKQDIIYKWANPGDFERNFPLCYLPTLLQETGDLSILKEIAEMFDHIIIPRNGNLLETLKALIKEFEP